MRALYDSKSKNDDRGIKKLLTKEATIESWLKVEAVLADAQADEGIIPREAADGIMENARLDRIDLEEMERIRDKVGHGFVPFVRVLVKACGEESGKYVHYGATTQNIQQTGQLYVMKKIHQIFKSFVADILENLAKLADDHADSVMPGRTHGRHAIPITFGYKASVWISELMNAVERIEESEKRVFQVMAGGAVGALLGALLHIGATSYGVSGLPGFLLTLDCTWQDALMLAVTFVVTFAATWVTWKEVPQERDAETDSERETENERAETTGEENSEDKIASEAAGSRSIEKSAVENADKKNAAPLDKLPDSSCSVHLRLTPVL